MIGLLGFDFLEDVGGLQLICVSDIGWFGGLEQGERVEDGGFGVIRILERYTFHGVGIELAARGLIKLVGIFEEKIQGVKPVGFALRLGPERFTLFDGVVAALQGV